jgi:hypothetical protein
MTEHVHSAGSEALARLGALAEAARAAGADPEIVTLLERSRERIRYLAGWSGPLGDPDSDLAPQLAGPGQLPEALAALITEAVDGGVPTWITNLLSTTHMRLVKELGQPAAGPDQRLADRLDEDQAAQLRRADGSELAVLVVDRSPLGLGLLSEQSLAPHELVELTILGDAADEHHQAEVIFCLARGETAYHIGVELLVSG